MKTIGLLGGMSWESMLTYYRVINQGVRAAFGGLHSARICLYSVDFEEIEELQRRSEWHRAGEALAAAARSVEAGGADFLVLCTNTMHRVASSIEAAVSIPLLHIADATARRLVVDGVERVGLLGTRFTMEGDFYSGRLKDLFGLEVLVPTAEQRDLVHGVIYRELCRGVVREASREHYL